VVKTVTFDFVGRWWQFIVNGFCMMLMSLLVFPAAWGAAAFYRWFVNSVTFSSGTKAVFIGRPREVWHYFALLSVTSIFPQLLKNGDDPASLWIVLAVTIVFIPVNVALWQKIIQWFIAGVRLTTGIPMKFECKYKDFLEWCALLFVSFFTLILWAWVLVAMIRWMCRHITYDENQNEFYANRIVFEGKGWSLLWRSVIGGAACCLIIPIPFVWIWINRWGIRQLKVEGEPIEEIADERSGLA
jgi:hypothetical protein